MHYKKSIDFQWSEADENKEKSVKIKLFLMVTGYFQRHLATENKIYFWWYLSKVVLFLAAFRCRRK
jgi:hypothetical protein